MNFLKYFEMKLIDGPYILLRLGQDHTQEFINDLSVTQIIRSLHVIDKNALGKPVIFSAMTRCIHVGCSLVVTTVGTS